MRVPIIAILLLAATPAAHAQCALGSFPTTNSNGAIVCQSAGGQRPPSSDFDPGGGQIGPCPRGTTSGRDSWGNRTCSSLVEQPVAAPSGGRPAKPAKRKAFEISKKCPQCK